MKNAILAFALAAVAVSCTQTSEEVVIEETVVENLDSLEAEAYEGDEAAAE